MNDNNDKFDKSFTEEIHFETQEYDKKRNIEICTTVCHKVKSHVYNNLNKNYSIICDVIVGSDTCKKCYKFVDIDYRNKIVVCEKTKEFI